MNEGYVASVLGLKGLPREAYEMDVARNALLSLMTGCRLHVLHVSTAREVELIRAFKAMGAKMTAETGSALLVPDRRSLPRLQHEREDESAAPNSKPIATRLSPGLQRRRR